MRLLIDSLEMYSTSRGTEARMPDAEIRYFASPYVQPTQDYSMLHYTLHSTQCRIYE